MIISLDLSGTNTKVEKLSPTQSVTADFNQVYFRNLDDGMIVGDNGAVYIVSNASGNLLWYPVTGAPSSDITHVYSNSASVGVVTMGGKKTQTTNPFRRYKLTILHRNYSQPQIPNITSV
jgi:hypothetical protein